MVWSKFNFDVWFVIYRFFKFQIILDTITSLPLTFLYTRIHPPVLQHLRAAPLFPRHADFLQPQHILFLLKWYLEASPSYEFLLG
jgi:hypothetical protein